MATTSLEFDARLARLDEARADQRRDLARFQEFGARQAR